MGRAANRASAVAVLGEHTDHFAGVFGVRRGAGGFAGRYAELLRRVQAEGQIDGALAELRRNPSALSGNVDTQLLLRAISSKLLRDADARYLGYTRELMHLMGITAKFSEQQVWLQIQGHKPVLHLTRARKDPWMPALQDRRLHTLCGVLRPQSPYLVGPPTLAARGAWRQLSASPQPSAERCSLCAAAAGSHYPRDFEETADYPLFRYRGAGWRTKLSAGLDRHLQQAVFGPAEDCSAAALTQWLTLTYRTGLVEYIADDAVARRDDVLRNAMILAEYPHGERAYQHLLTLYGYARGRASKPTLWQDLRGNWPAWADDWLRRAPTPPSSAEIVAAYRRRLAQAAACATSP